MTFSQMVLAELGRARQKFPRSQHSVAEGREVIREEFEEFVVASRHGEQYAPIAGAAEAVQELVQLAAMCYRTAIEVYGFPEESSERKPSLPALVCPECHRVHDPADEHSRG